ncbi:hypothetical protein KSP40_PGU002662 [Platanthera guangdongensis]|uniref:Uncharacterized protein n=1 Tax=Platanthera guangdongensis TaxID=2320717 RepID=A0ABR2MV18_9ASPA
MRRCGRGGEGLRWCSGLDRVSLRRCGHDNEGLRECSGLDGGFLRWCGLASMACVSAVGLDRVSPLVAGGLVVIRRRRFSSLFRFICSCTPYKYLVVPGDSFRVISQHLPCSPPFIHPTSGVDTSRVSDFLVNLLADACAFYIFMQLVHRCQFWVKELSLRNM